MNYSKISKFYKEVSYHRQHKELTLQEWQIALRRQFAEKNHFELLNLGEHPVFSDFRISNPTNNNTYKVAIRDCSYDMNYCSCNDFKTNDLGTCKHIEVVLLHIQKNRKLKAQFKPGHEMPHTSVYLKYTGGRHVKIRIGKEKHDKYVALARKYFDQEGFLLPEAEMDFDVFIAKAKKISPDFRCYSDALEYILAKRDKAFREKIVKERYINKSRTSAFKQIMKASLFPYQQDGILFSFIAGRALIADDMGLGKTVQAIATAEMMKKELGIASVLIVCPTTLKYQWKSEIEKFSSSAVHVIEGIAWKRKDQYVLDVFYKIVSYHTLANDIDFINENPPDLIVLDEAQRIKNFKTKISKAVKKTRSDYSIVLTGTPIENKLEELYSIIQFIDPFKLGAYHQFLNDHQTKSATGMVTGYKGLNKVGEAISDIMIRRKKTEVMDQLPDRRDKILYVSMTEEQWLAHDEYKYAVSKLIHKWKRFGFLSEQDRQKLMIFLNSMRMICNSTYILDQETRYDTKIEEAMHIVDEMIQQGDEKAVIFSQWERMTRLIAQELERRKIPFQYLHGGVPGKDREKLYKTFNGDQDCRVFLSTDAGGVGLNLQAGSLMINLDIPWNPAVLEQRISRIYRMGQKRKINVINLVASGTIEHRMLEVIKIKSQLSRGVLDAGEDTIFIGESRFRKFMDTVEEMMDTPTHQTKQEPMLESLEVPDEKKMKKIAGEGSEIQDDLFSEIPSDDDDSTIADAPEVAEIQQPTEVLQMGLAFLNNMSQILSDKEATQQFVSQIVQKDTDGKPYLKIPIESEKVVANILGMIGGFLRKN